MIAMKLNSTATMTYLQLETRIMHDRNLSKHIFWHTYWQNAKLRPSFVNSWVAQGIRRRFGPRHPIFHYKIFSMQSYLQQSFYSKISWNVLSDIYLSCLIHFFKWKVSFSNCNRVKIWTKNLLLSLRNEVFFLKKGNPIFRLALNRYWETNFSTLCKKFQIFSFILFEKRRGARLPTLPYWPRAALLDFGDHQIFQYRISYRRIFLAIRLTFRNYYYAKSMSYLIRLIFFDFLLYREVVNSNQIKLLLGMYLS